MTRLFCVALTALFAISSPAEAQSFPVAGVVNNPERFTRHQPHVLLGWCPADGTAVWLSGTYGQCGPDDELLLSAPRKAPTGKSTRFTYFNANDATSGIQPPVRSYRVRRSGRSTYRYRTLEGYQSWMTGANSTQVTVSTRVGVGNQVVIPGQMRRVQ